MRSIPIGSREILVSDEDYDHLARFRWSLSRGYARRNAGGYRLQMHIEVLNRMGVAIPVGCLPHHRDLNPLNNQRSNLRVVPFWENNYHSRERRRLCLLFGIEYHDVIHLPHGT